MTECPEKVRKKAMIKKNYIDTEKVKFYTEEAVCDKCGGTMLPQPMIFYTFPPAYPYKCEKCNCVEVLRDYVQAGVVKIEQKD